MKSLDVLAFQIARLEDVQLQRDNWWLQKQIIINLKNQLRQTEITYSSLSST